MQLNNNFTASFDYYNVEITDAIAPLNSLFAYQQCFNANGCDQSDAVVCRQANTAL